MPRTLTDLTAPRGTRVRVNGSFTDNRSLRGSVEGVSNTYYLVRIDSAWWSVPNPAYFMPRELDVDVCEGVLERRAQRDAQNQL